MQDPGKGVHPLLLNHVHLLSTARYPFEPSQLPIRTIFSHLVNAPHVVKEQRPVVWQYLTPPQDGTILLAWQPTAQVGQIYATDGYIWAEPENVFTHQYNDYVLMA